MKIRIIKTLFLTFCIYQINAIPISCEQENSVEISASSEITSDEIVSLPGSSEISFEGDVIDPNDVIVKTIYYDSDSSESLEKKLVKRDISEPPRGKRALVFRPLFVYKQQEIKRQRVKEQRQRTTKKSNSSRPRPSG